MKLIDPEQIRFVIAPIAPMLIGEQVHYERVAFDHDVSRIPRIEAEPLLTAQWIISYKEPKPRDCFIPIECRCSRCGQEIDPDSSRLFRYCPNCGSRMGF